MTARPMVDQIDEPALSQAPSNRFIHAENPAAARHVDVLALGEGSNLRFGLRLHASKAYNSPARQ